MSETPMEPDPTLEPVDPDAPKTTVPGGIEEDPDDNDIAPPDPTEDV
ncbi:hypothetical protein [Aeromicrobium sp. UC242_57]